MTAIFVATKRANIKGAKRNVALCSVFYVFCTFALFQYLPIGGFFYAVLFVFYLKSFYLTNMNRKVIILGCGTGLMFALEKAILTFAQEHVVTIVDKPVDDYHKILLAEPPEPIELKMLKRINMARGRSTRFYFKDDDPCENAYTRKPFVLPQINYISQQIRLRNKAPPVWVLTTYYKTKENQKYRCCPKTLTYYRLAPIQSRSLSKTI